MIDLGDDVILHTQDEWRSDREQAVGGSLEVRPNGGELAVREIIGHGVHGTHLGADDPVEWLRGIFHHQVESLRYPDIGWHSAVVNGGDQNGALYELRDNANVGQHTTARPPDGIDHNAIGHGVVILHYAPLLTPKAKVALRKLHGLVVVSNGWKLPNRLVHKDVDSNARCLGDDVRDFFHNAMAQPSPAPEGGVIPGVEHPIPQAYEPPEYPGKPLKEGAKGDVVKQWQERLEALGYGPLDVDGTFGPRTEASTMRLQTSLGLTMDGVVGPETWEAAW